MTQDAKSQSKTEHEHIPQCSADEYEYIDDRGIKIADRSWTCPSCGDEGMLMHRPGSKNTCASCFWVHNGNYNDYVLRDWPLTYRQAQRLLAQRGEAWHMTPGGVSSELRTVFDSPEEAAAEIKNRGGKPQLGFTQLGDF